MKSKRILFLLLLTTTFFRFLSAQQLPDTIAKLGDRSQISLITNTMLEGEIYELFGHTSIRVYDNEKKIDQIFNYGLFDFNSPHFIFRFVTGKTDYMVGIIDYQYYKAYIEEYKKQGINVTEQILHLTLKEKQDIYNALNINCLPENRVYRYNYFYDNCSTRARDIIERYIQGKIEFVPTNKKQSFRDLVHECTVGTPWTQFGIDLVIGADADKIITDRQKDFLPLHLMNAFDKAIIKNTEGTDRKLVIETKKILESADLQLLANKKDFLHNPLIIGYLIFTLAIIVSVLVYTLRWFVLGKIFDTPLFFIAGLAGSIILFLLLFSYHPCVNPNWNIIWLHPLHLIVGLFSFTKSFSKVIIYYHFINFVVLIVFLLAWTLIPQKLDIAFIPFILTMATRSLMNVISQKKRKKKFEYSLPKIR